MNVLSWIILSSIAMSLIAWSGLLILFFKEPVLKKILLPLVSFSAGSLIGASFLHLLPEALEKIPTKENMLNIFGWLLVGFTVFFILENFINWHHCHRPLSKHKKPVTYLILIADGLHNFIGGIAIGGSFVAGIPVGIVTWLAAAAHEIPQELGDFGILIYGGWNKTTALIYNFLSALTVLLGGLFAYFITRSIDTSLILGFAAGNFLYIGAADLVPEIKQEKCMKKNIIILISFISGMAVIWGVRRLFNL